MHRRDWLPDRARRPIEDVRSLMPLRRHSGLGTRRRIVIHVRRDEILTRLAELDAALSALTEERLALLSQLDELREQLWPATPHKGRRPPAHDEPALSPAAADARPLSGRRLRSLCIAILHRHGRLALRDLHDLIHRYGYEVAGRTPVKALADAMGYEVDQGRARRVARGTYALAPGTRPRRGDAKALPLLPGGPGGGGTARPSDPVGRGPAVDPDVVDDPTDVPSDTVPESYGGVHRSFTSCGASRNQPSVPCDASPPKQQRHRPRRAPLEHQEEPTDLAGRPFRELHARGGSLRR